MSTQLRLASAVKLAAGLRQTSTELELAAAAIIRATRTLEGRCRMTQKVIDTGRPLQELTVAELSALAAQVVRP